MTEKPILFNTEMVKAVLDGRKTQTRRIIKNLATKEVVFSPEVTIESKETADMIYFNEYQDRWEAVYYHKNTIGGHQEIKCPYEVGMKLWVRETFAILEEHTQTKLKGFAYKADDKDFYHQNCPTLILLKSDLKWKPSIFMPRIASRITLEITNIRVERLQEITDEDAESEGIHREFDGTHMWYENYEYIDKNKDWQVSMFKYPTSRKKSFQSLWNLINEKRGYGWETNPFVWVYEFKVVK